jgi:hypothetical protein
MNKIKKIISWCPQPKYPVQVDGTFTRLSKPMLVFTLLVEIIGLLIVPMACYALLVPKNVIVRPDQTLLLTDSQIKSAWPNLPTAQQIFKNGGCTLVNSNTPAFNDVKNHTRISPVNAIPSASPPPSDHVLFVRLAPVEYFIWLQLNSTTWVSPGQQYLATNNPPYVLSSSYYTEQVGFLGTGLPTAYFTIAAIVILATLMAGTTYLILHKRSVH